MYDGKTQLPIKNPIDRYLINSPMPPGKSRWAQSPLDRHHQTRNTRLAIFRSLGLASMTSALVMVLGVFLILAPLPVVADNVVGVDKAHAEMIAQLLTPGDILIWNCPTCRGVRVMTVEQVRVSKWGNSPDFAVMVKRDVLISSRRISESLGWLGCADLARRDPDAEPDGWPLDLTYTYIKTGDHRQYVSIGRTVGVTNNPVPTISLTADALANINRCAAKHKRPPNAFDDDRDPLLERLISRNDHVRSAALASMSAALRGMSAPARERLIVGLIDETGDVGTMEAGPGNSERAGRALFEMGSVAAPYLLRTVRDKTEDTMFRDVNARLLGRIRPVAQETISGLVATLTEEIRSPPRGGVAFALGEMGVATEQVVQTLKRALAYRSSASPSGIDLDSFTEIAIALTKLGSEPKDAIAVLIKTLNDENPQVEREMVLTALEKIGTAEALDAVKRYRREHPGGKTGPT